MHPFFILILYGVTNHTGYPRPTDTNPLRRVVLVCRLWNTTAGQPTPGLLPTGNVEVRRLKRSLHGYSSKPLLLKKKTFTSCSFAFQFCLDRRVNSTKLYLKEFFANSKSDKSGSPNSLSFRTRSHMPKRIIQAWTVRWGVCSLEREKGIRASSHWWPICTVHSMGSLGQWLEFRDISSHQQRQCPGLMIVLLTRATG